MPDCRLPSPVSPGRKKMNVPFSLGQVMNFWYQIRLLATSTLLPKFPPQFKVPRRALAATSNAREFLQASLATSNERFAHSVGEVSVLRLNLGDRSGGGRTDVRISLIGWLVAAFIGTVYLVQFGCQERPSSAISDVLRTRRLEVSDSSGNPRLVMSVGEFDDSFITMKSSDGKQLMSIHASPTVGTFISMNGSDGWERLGISVGSNGFTSVALSYQRILRIVLSLSRDGEPVLVLADERGKSRLALLLDKSGNASLVTYDEKGNAKKSRILH